MSTSRIYVGPCNLTELVSEHFSSRGWLTIQDQINAGYPYYVQPTKLTGNLLNVFTFGGQFVNSVLTIQTLQEIIAGDVQFSYQIRLFLTGVQQAVFNTVSAFVNTPIPFDVVLVTIFLNAKDDRSFCYVYDFRCTLEVMIQSESGSTVCSALDSGGTTVNFTKTFKSINSVILSAAGLVPLTALYDIPETANPTGFKIIVFDKDGNRANGTISWQVTGVQ